MRAGGSAALSGGKPKRYAEERTRGGLKVGQFEPGRLRPRSPPQDIDSAFLMASTSAFFPSHTGSTMARGRAATLARLPSLQ